MEIRMRDKIGLFKYLFGNTLMKCETDNICHTRRWAVNPEKHGRILEITQSYLLGPTSISIMK